MSSTWVVQGLDLKNSPSLKFSWIWNVDIMPKMKVFLWQLCHDLLPARKSLMHQGLYINPSCRFCAYEIEDAKHLFLRCLVALEVRKHALDHN